MKGVELQDLNPSQLSDDKLIFCLCKFTSWKLILLFIIQDTHTPATGCDCWVNGSSINADTPMMVLDRTPQWGEVRKMDGHKSCTLCRWKARSGLLWSVCAEDVHRRAEPDVGHLTAEHYFMRLKLGFPFNKRCAQQCRSAEVLHDRAGFSVIMHLLLI